MMQDICFLGLVYPYFMEQYKQNPEKAIDSLKEYIEMVKHDIFNGALQCLGIEVNEKVIPKLINISKNRIENVEQLEKKLNKDLGNEER